MKKAHVKALPEAGKKVVRTDWKKKYEDLQEDMAADANLESIEIALRMGKLQDSNTFLTKELEKAHETVTQINKVMQELVVENEKQAEVLAEKTYGSTAMPEGVILTHIAAMPILRRAEFLNKAFIEVGAILDFTTQEKRKELDTHISLQGQLRITSTRIIDGEFK